MTKREYQEETNEEAMRRIDETFERIINGEPARKD